MPSRTHLPRSPHYQVQNENSNPRQASSSVRAQSQERPRTPLPTKTTTMSTPQAKRPHAWAQNVIAPHLSPSSPSPFIPDSPTIHGSRSMCAVVKGEDRGEDAYSQFAGMDEGRKDDPFGILAAERRQRQRERARTTKMFRLDLGPGPFARAASVEGETTSNKSRYGQVLVAMGVRPMPIEGTGDRSIEASSDGRSAFATPLRNQRKRKRTRTDRNNENSTTNDGRGSGSTTPQHQRRRQRQFSLSSDSEESSFVSSQSLKETNTGKSGTLKRRLPLADVTVAENDATPAHTTAQRTRTSKRLAAGVSGLGTYGSTDELMGLLPRRPGEFGTRARNSTRSGKKKATARPTQKTYRLEKSAKTGTQMRSLSSNRMRAASKTGGEDDDDLTREGESFVFDDDDERETYERERLARREYFATVDAYEMATEGTWVI